MNRFGARLTLTALVLTALLVPRGTLDAQGVVHDACSYCHDVHGAGGFVPLTAFNRDVDLCLSCHGDAGPAVFNGEIVPKDVDIHIGARHILPDSTTCVECHDHEGETGTNLALIPQVLTNAYTAVTGRTAVVFTSRTGTNSFADADGVFDGICEVCHTATTEHRFDGSVGQHDAATDCRFCHSHAEGWAPVRGCTSAGCHDVIQGTRRAVLSSADDEFQRRSHHADNLQDTDCVACHETRFHKGGVVRFHNVDTGSIIELTSGAFTVADSAATLTPFCLACHDQTDGNPSSPPFADGQMPPGIDALLWAGSSHNTAPLTCAGAAAFGCHATGHGSQKDWLLAPPTVGPGTNNANEEEGFCYACHDGSPASTDIQAEFARTSRHNVSAGDPGGEFVECTSCHNPHVASATNKLADPDATATPWAGTFEGFCLACHDGGAPTGISFPTPNWSGFDKSTFVGSSHDTQQGGTDSCRACHEQHGANQQSLLVAKLVMTDFNQWSMGDGDYQLCWNCHNENFIMNQNNAFEDLHDKHVRGEDAPCVMCHDAHAPHDAGEPMINFDWAVQAGYDISYIDGRNGTTSYFINGNRGECYIMCHGKRHDTKDYNRP